MSEKVDNLLSTLFKERCHILIEGLRKTKHNKTRPYKKYITLPDEFKISWMDGPRNIKKRYYHTLRKIEKPGKPGQFQINQDVAIYAAILVEQDKTITKIFDDVEARITIFGLY